MAALTADLGPMRGDILRVSTPTRLSTDVTLWIQPYAARLYRATLVGDGEVKITSLSPLTRGLPDNYTLGDDPKWITDRISALMLLPLPPPPHLVDNVGMRISDTTFWIIAPEDW